MLYESDIIKAVCGFLSFQGYRIAQQLKETQRGEDIIAISQDGKEVFIEAKGETSSKELTARFGKPFDRAQVRNHVASAFFKAACKIRSDNNPLICSAIALPKTRHHIEMVEQIIIALKLLQIEVFWVDSEGSVEVIGNWDKF